MCGRYYFSDDDDDDAEEFRKIVEQVQKKLFGSPLLSQMKRGEIFPTDIVPVYSSTTPTLMKWGFPKIDGTGQIINARIETAAEKPMFKKSFASHRCLIPARNYFEWQKTELGKRRHSIGIGKPFFMAGLYKEVPDSPVPVFVILTRAAAPGIEFIHDRMPVILTGGLQKSWITYATSNFDVAPNDIVYEAC